MCTTFTKIPTFEKGAQGQKETQKMSRAPLWTVSNKMGFVKFILTHRAGGRSDVVSNEM